MDDNIKRMLEERKSALEMTRRFAADPLRDIRDLTYVPTSERYMQQMEKIRQSMTSAAQTNAESIQQAIRHITSLQAGLADDEQLLGVALDNR